MGGVGQELIQKEKSHIKGTNKSSHWIRIAELKNISKWKERVYCYRLYKARCKHKKKNMIVSNTDIEHHLIIQNSS